MWMPLRKFCHIGEVSEVNTSRATAVATTDVGNPRNSTLRKTSMEIKKILMDNQEEDTVENLGETNEVLEELHKNTEGTSEETRG